MTQRKLLALLVLAFGSAASPARAEVMFTLSSPSDLSALTVGQTVEIDLSLSGLPSPNNGTDFIFNLETKILFSSALFQAIPDPVSASGLTAEVAPGSVFDNPFTGTLQVANFNAQSSLVAGAASGNFSQFPNTNSGPIGLNGLYYSFLLRVEAVGTGSISFDPTDGANQYAANETGFNFAPLNTNGNLAFTVGAVPEPASITMLVLGGAILGCWKHARRQACRRG